MWQRRWRRAIMPKFLHLVVRLEVSQAPIGIFVVVVVLRYSIGVSCFPMISSQTDDDGRCWRWSGNIQLYEIRMIETFGRLNLFVAHTFYFENLLNEHRSKRRWWYYTQTVFEIVFHSNANAIVKRKRRRGGKNNRKCLWKNRPIF